MDQKIIIYQQGQYDQIGTVGLEPLNMGGRQQHSQGLQVNEYERLVSWEEVGFVEESVRRGSGKSTRERKNLASQHGSYLVQI